MEMYDSKKQPRGVLYIEKKQKMWKEREKKKRIRDRPVLLESEAINKAIESRAG